MSTFWCDGIQIDADGKVDAFYFNHEPEMHKEGNAETNTQVSVRLEPGEFKMITFTMTTDSHIAIVGGSLDGILAKLWIFDDRYEAKDCITDVDKCSKSKTDPTRIPLFRKANNGSPFLEYQVPSYGTYYLVIKNMDRHESFLDLSIHISRSSFDLSEASETCLDSYRCAFQFPFASEAHVAVTNQEEEETISLVTHCQNRLIVYLLIFLVLPIVAFGLVICLSCHYSPGNASEAFPHTFVKMKGGKRVSFALDIEQCPANTLDSAPVSKRSPSAMDPLMQTPSTSYGGIYHDRKRKPVQNLPKTHNDVYNRTMFTAIKRGQCVQIYPSV